VDFEVDECLLFLRIEPDGSHLFPEFMQVGGISSQNLDDGPFSGISELLGVVLAIGSFEVSFEEREVAFEGGVHGSKISLE
jgi:hypothetical protein